MGAYAIAAAATGWGKSGGGTTGLYVAAVIAAISAVTWASTPALLGGRGAALFATMADLTVAAALDCLRDPVLMLAGCGLFALHAVYVALHVRPVGMVVHSVFVTLFICNAAVFVAHTTPNLMVVTIMGTAILLSVVVAVPLVVRTLWVGINSAAEMARYDPLTGVLNRTGLDMRYRRLADTARTSPSEMVVVAVDLDGFKSVNDRYGHAVGDEVLIEAARHLNQHFGHTAAVARCGGEEFTVIAIGEPIKLHRLVHSLTTRTPGIRGPTTHMSVGAAWCDRTHPPGALHRAMAAADHSMYTAKGLGGDRVCSTLEDRA